MEVLKRLDMAKVRFRVDITPADFRADGADDVEFLSSRNEAAAAYAPAPQAPAAPDPSYEEVDDNDLPF